MFAPKVARPQAKVKAEPMSALARQRSTPVAHRSDQDSANASTTSRVSWDFSKIPVFAPDRAAHPMPSSPLTAAPSTSAIQTKFVVGEVNDPLEHEADRVADQVMRAPTPNRRTSPAAYPYDLQGKARDTQTEQDTSSVARDEISETVREVLGGPGKPLDLATRSFLEPRVGTDLDRVRVHEDDAAARSAQAIGARAYTVGANIVFSPGQYAPQTNAGMRLLAHEVTHTLQKRTAATLLRQKGGDHTTHTKHTMHLTTGGVVFEKDARDDVLKLGALMPSADQAHIGFSGDLLGYDSAYTTPEDPFRWSKLKDVIDSGEKVRVMRVHVGGPIKVKFITGKGSSDIDDIMRQEGLTLPTEARERMIYPSEKTFTASPSADTHYVYYGGLTQGAASALAHEFFGHLWLAIKLVPFVHPSKPDEIKAKGTLTKAHGVLDPFGNVFEGTVQDYIDRFVGSETGALKSPTIGVGTAGLAANLASFKTEFVKGATKDKTGAWKVSDAAGLNWEILTRNYNALPATMPGRPQTGRPLRAPGCHPGRQSKPT